MAQTFISSDLIITGHEESPAPPTGISFDNEVTFANTTIIPINFPEPDIQMKKLLGAVPYLEINNKMLYVYFLKDSLYPVVFNSSGNIECLPIKLDEN